jgi:hypothetical protein
LKFPPPFPNGLISGSGSLGSTILGRPQQSRTLLDLRLLSKKAQTSRFPVRFKSQYLWQQSGPFAKMSEFKKAEIAKMSELKMAENGKMSEFKKAQNGKMSEFGR